MKVGDHVVLYRDNLPEELRVVTEVSAKTFTASRLEDSRDFKLYGSLDEVKFLLSTGRPTRKGSIWESAGPVDPEYWPNLRVNALRNAIRQNLLEVEDAGKLQRVLAVLRER
jgi:hypothetical protein